MDKLNNRIVLALISKEIFDVIQDSYLEPANSYLGYSGVHPNPKEPFGFTNEQMTQARKDRWWIKHRYESIKGKNDIVWTSIASRLDWLNTLETE